MILVLEFYTCEVSINWINSLKQSVDVIQNMIYQQVWKI